MKRLLSIHSRPLETVPQLSAFPSHEGIYHFRDLKYVVRIIRKIARDLSKKTRDIDWLQNHIESFLVQNSRVYEDLLKELIDGVRQHHPSVPSDLFLRVLDRASGTLSMRYHKEKRFYRNRAAHGSNYLRVGIPEFQNDILPKPLNYHQTQKLLNMAKVKDLMGMWSTDMQKCAEEIEALVTFTVNELNKYDGSINI